MEPIGHVATLFTQFGYAILLPLGIIEGPIVSVASGILIHLSFFQFWPVFWILLAGDIIGDIFWYSIGYHGGIRFIRRYGHFFGLSESTAERISHLFHRHHEKILLTSKLTMGFGFALATLIAAGMARVPFRKFIFINIAAGVVWTTFLIGVGYFFGNVYALIDKGFQGVFLGALFITLVYTLYRLNIYFRHHLPRS
ncbi:MAG: hypothetical protein RIQ54_274 [Candidatus Parcubacteria bacterium]|jgi:membrane protein DedA with SNARE-associated domain